MFDSGSSHASLGDLSSPDACAERARCAFATELEGMRPYLMRFARSRLQDAHTAEDLVQEALLAALTGRNPFLGKSALRTWLTSILYHKIVDRYRALGQQQTCRAPEHCDDDEAAEYTEALQSQAAAAAGQASEDPCREIERRQLSAQLTAALKSLPARQRDVFVLVQMHGYSGAEAAAAAGLTQSNVWVMLHRARKLLQVQLQGAYR